MLFLPTVLVTTASAVYFFGVGWPSRESSSGQAGGSAKVVTFKRRFRILVFTFIGVLPLGLALSIGFVFGFMADALVFAVIAILTLPWAMMKIIAELKRNRP